MYYDVFEFGLLSIPDSRCLNGRYFRIEGGLVSSQGSDALIHCGAGPKPVQSDQPSEACRSPKGPICPRLEGLFTSRLWSPWGIKLQAGCREFDWLSYLYMLALSLLLRQTTRRFGPCLSHLQRGGRFSWGSHWGR